MSRVSKIRSNEQLIETIHQSGYVVIVFTRAGDWPSEQFAGKCAEYSRAFPYVCFGAVDASISRVEVGGSPLTHVPTTAFYRNGKAFAQIVGTNYSEMEKILAGTRRDGASLITSPQFTGKNYISAPVNQALFARRKR